MTAESQRLGKYVLKEKIATGGMAEIWLSEQQGPGGFTKRLVVKRILPHLANDPRFIEMFLDEARLAAQLTHPNIVQIYDLGEADGSYFIAMEYVKGYDLEAIVNQATSFGERLDPAMVARLVADACAALDYAHNFAGSDGVNLHLVHRDISPQNILVSEKGVVKLVDFGVAKAATSSHKTQTGAVKGKFCYMSPEQIAGQTLDARSDLFAVGIVLYELLTGHRPFGHESELLAVTAILHQPPPPLRQFGAEVPQGLEQIVFRALDKDRQRRYQSADALQAALEGFLTQSGRLVRSKDLSAYMAGLFGDSPRFPTTIPSGPALAETQFSTSPDATATALSHQGSQPGVGAPSEPPRGTMVESGLGPPPQAPGPAVGSNPGLSAPAHGPPPGQSAHGRPFMVPAGHADETQSLQPGSGVHSMSSASGRKGIGAGLILLLLLVLGGLGLGGYVLVDFMSNGEESESDAGGIAEGDVEGPDEEDAHRAESDAGEAADVTGVDTALANADAGTSQGEPVVDSPDGGQAQAEDDADEVPDTAGDVELASADTATGDTATGDAEPADEDTAVAVADSQPSDEDTTVAQVDSGQESGEDAGQAPDTAEPDTAVALADEDTGQQEADEDTGQQEADTGQQATVDAGTVEDEPVAEERDTRPDDRPGRLSVMALPPGRYEAFLDGESLGNLPLRGHELPPGRYSLVVRNSSGDERSKRVRVRPGRRLSERFDFRDSEEDGE